MASTRTCKNGHAAIWRDPEGRQRSKQPFPGKRAALAYAREQERDIRAGTYVDPHSPTTVLDFAREYAAMKVDRRLHRATTAARMQSVIRNHIAGTALGGMRLVDVKRLHWDRWEGERFNKVRPAYARKVISDVRSIFAAAVDYELIPKSPAPRKVEQSAPRSVKIEKTYTRGQYERLVAAMEEIRPCCTAMVIVQAGLGLRLGELISLRVQDVNRRARTVRIETQITGTAGAGRTDELKTDRSTATMRVPQYVIDALVKHRETYPTGIDGTIFTIGGRPWRQRTYRDVFNKALAHAGLPTTWRDHDLRHFCATEMLAAGCTYPQVARYLRETEQTVIATYGHATDDEHAVAEGMDRAWRARTGS